MPKSSHIKTGIRTLSILKILAVLVLWVLIMGAIARLLLPRQDRNHQNDPEPAARKTAFLLAEHTREKLRGPPLGRAGKIVRSEDNGSMYSITWQGKTNTDLILAEKAISDFWKGLGNLEVKIEYPDHPLHGEKIRLLASSGNKPLMEVLLAGEGRPAKDPNPTPPPSSKPEEKPPPKKQSAKLFPDPVSRAGKIVIIIDDVGFNLAALDKLLRIKEPITFAVLPNAPQSTEAVKRIKSKGAELMLHMPMEPMSYPQSDPGKGALFLGMTQQEVKDRVLHALEAVPGARGVNNHMGSAFTADPEGVEKLLVVLKKQGLYFVDSRTTVDTVAYKTAGIMEVPCTKRDVFLDHHLSSSYIKRSLVKLSLTANRQESAVAIGHPHPETVRALTRYLPLMAEKGYRFAYASEVVK